MRALALLMAASPALLAACSSPINGGPTPGALPSAAPGAASVPEPAASASDGAPAASGSAQAPAPASSFVAVGAIPEPARLFPIEGAMFIASTGPSSFGREPQEDDTAGYVIGVLREGKLEFPEKMRIDRALRRIDFVAGRWPDSVDMLSIADTGRSGMAEHFALTSTGWDKRRGRCRQSGQDTICEAGTVFTGLEKVGDSLIATEIPIMFGDPTFTALRGPAIQRKFTPAHNCPEGTMRPRKAQVLPSAFGALKDGSLITYGYTCDDKTFIERWKPEGGEPTLSPISGPAPGDSGELARFFHGPAGETYLLAGKVTQFTEAGWKDIPGPTAGPLEHATVASDGALWVGDDHHVWRRNGEQWEEMQLPPDLTRVESLATFDGQIWVATLGTLLRQRRPGETGPGAPIKAQEARPAGRKKFVRPGSARCAQNLVLLYAFTRVTPDDYDFPLTRKALKGHTEYKDARFVVTRDGGKKFFSAQVASFEQGKRLVKLIENEVSGSKPQLICAEPEILREVKIDLRTGKTLP
jgi:hypothetical protein